MDDVLGTRENSGLDIGRFICAILVIAIHTEPFANYIWLDRGLGIITRLSVPFFFMLTGYFFFNGSDNEKKLKHSLLRLLALYIIWSLIYLPFNWPIESPLKSILITGVNSHLWYVPAVMFALIIIFFLHKCLDMGKILTIASFLLVIGTLLSTYEPIISKIIGGGHWIYGIIDIIDTRNGLFYGFFYVTLGAFLQNIKPMKIVICIRWFIMGMILLSTEILIAVMVLNSKNTVLWITCPFAMVGMFGFFRNIYFKRKTENIRKISSCMYFSHYIWIYLLGIQHGMLLFITTLIISVFSSFVVVKLSIKVKGLKCLF